jgi:hypothetical protein
MEEVFPGPLRIDNGTKPRKKKEPFSPDEDLRLRDLVSELGAQGWTTISRHFPGRTERQCRERWNLYLAPNINNEAWTLEEIQNLMQSYFAVDPRWTVIANGFPNRMANNVKNKTKQCLRRMQKSFRFGERKEISVSSQDILLAQQNHPPTPPV